MKEHSELELNKMMATLDFDAKDIEYPIYGKGYPYVRYFEGDVLHRFNAIINKEYLFDLMVKYKVDIVHGKSLSTARIYDDPEDNPVASIDFYHEEVSYGKAIIMCILKSENII